MKLSSGPDLLYIIMLVNPKAEHRCIMENIQNMLKTYLWPLLATLKNSFISAASIFTAFVAPLGDLLTFVSLLILLDFISGVIAAKHRGEVRSSIKMMKSVWKMTFYICTLILMQSFDNLTKTLFHPHLISVILGPDNAATLAEFKFLAALSFIVIVRELKSIDENWGTIFGWSFISSGTTLYYQILSLISLFKLKK